MIKKALIVCAVLALTVVLAGVAGNIQIGIASNPSTASTPRNLQFQSYNGPVVGSKNSNVYHYPSCYEAKKIKPENLVTFPTIADACAAGYRPCKVCDPPACGAVQPTATPTVVPTATPTAAPTAAATAQPQLATSPTPTAAPTTSKATPTATSTTTSNVGQATQAASSSSTPGFEAIYALGALAAVVLAITVRRRK
jgi:hypothetical protein